MTTPTLRQIMIEKALNGRSSHEELLISSGNDFDRAASSRGLACCGYCRSQVAALTCVQELHCMRACSVADCHVPCRLQMHPEDKHAAQTRLLTGALL